jgi:hypothetical protein
MTLGMQVRTGRSRRTCAIVRENVKETAMRNLAFLGVVGVIAAGTALAKDAAAPKQPARRRPAIGILPVRGQFETRVQTSPRFKKQNRPAASKPASVNGLQVTVQPEKKTFAGNGPLAFEVTLRNVSERPFQLDRATLLGGSPKLVISNQKTAAQWTAPELKKGATAKTVMLKPGKTVKYTLVVESRFIVPVPIPFPGPRPLPPRRFAPKAAQPGVLRQPGKPGIVIGGPIRRPPIFVNQLLPCGQGPCRGRIFLEFTAPDAAKSKTPFWSGKLASGTFDFEVGKPEPVWTPGQPLKKDQAIRLAHPVAERALSASYKPVAGLRPAKVGPWIESPEKTATAKQDKAGNWTVSWTSFPKTGHSYNVTVTVSKFGGAAVTEVFTGYSKAP